MSAPENERGADARLARILDRESDPPTDDRTWRRELIETMQRRHGIGLAPAPSCPCGGGIGRARCVVVDAPEGARFCSEPTDRGRCHNRLRAGADRCRAHGGPSRREQALGAVSTDQLLAEIARRPPSPG